MNVQVDRPESPPITIDDLNNGEVFRTPEVAGVFMRVNRVGMLGIVCAHVGDGDLIELPHDSEVVHYPNATLLTGKPVILKT